MGRLKKEYEFLDYINTPLTRESIKLIYNSNNIVYERVELYSDFIQSLMDLMFTTYLGDDRTDEDQQLNHFEWCWNKTIDNFKKEGIDFKRNVLGKNYFSNFMIDEFYLVSDKNKQLNRKLTKLWLYIFDYRIVKVRLDVDTFISLYRMFDKSLKNQ